MNSCSAAWPCACASRTTRIFFVQKLSHAELLERQSAKRERAGRLPFAVVLNNIRSLHNVGSIFRTADGAGVEKIFLCGITGIPPHAKISKTALGAEKNVAWEYGETARGCTKKLKAEGYQVVLLEQTKKSIPYERFRPRPPVALVLGNEITGVAEDLLALCDQAIEIEMTGLKISLNVTAAFAVAAYHIRSVITSSSAIESAAGTSPSEGRLPARRQEGIRPKIFGGQ